MDIATELRALHHIRRSGMVGLDPPAKAFRVMRAIRRLGQIGGAVAVAAIKHGDRIGLIDETEALTFAELDRRSDALAVALRARGTKEGAGIGILCRNHRYFLDATFAAGKLGARTLYLNTDFGGPQLRDVCEREGVSVLVHDEEFEQLAAPVKATRFTEDAMQELIDSNHGAVPPVPRESATMVLLT
ncbi:MAG TPA: AMP-binding protein, partial [Solirubrobacteraceae bacterium]|nr:AMP-binding protein [Solirubrobacteraceae bacterium]